jgi:hypothetical protein
MAMTPQTNAATSRETMRGHLAKLAGKLTSNGQLAELAGDIQKPYLNVALADNPAHTERVLCQLDDEGWWWFFWAWGEAIGAVDDLELGIDRIAVMLRSLEADA